jgi:heme/copper-type cytochrome/quinol oxidase subunit 2
MKKSTSFVHLITFKNIWNTINWVINIIGILFFIWVVLSLIYLIVLFGASFATTSFSESNSWAQLANSFFHLSVIEILSILALAISGINSVHKYLKTKDLEVDVNNLEVDNINLKEELRMKTLEFDAFKESLGK